VIRGVRAESIERFVEDRAFSLSRTCGVSIFIDYCTALATQRKVEGEERDTGLINMNEASSCIAWGYWR
jgi:hypothetical protein